MAQDKKLVEAITSMEVDFAQWYTDVVKKAELIEYSSIRGCMILRPQGYAIWENIQKQLDADFKATGVENVYMPMFIPESLLQKEKDHVEGFAPEVAWVTHGGGEPLQERMCVGLHQRHFSAIYILKLFSHTGICLNYIISGVR
jgi:prolyl-tRNA synthetase